MALYPEAIYAVADPRDDWKDPHQQLPCGSNEQVAAAVNLLAAKCPWIGDDGRLPQHRTHVLGALFLHHRSRLRSARLTDFLRSRLR
jgi:hypothetical protein